MVKQKNKSKAGDIIQNFNGGTIARVVSNNKRIGALVFRQGQKPLLLNENQLRQFGEYLRYTGQKLYNGRVTLDGRIVPIVGKSVENIDNSDYINALDKSTKTKTNAQTAQQSKSVPRPLLTQQTNVIKQLNPQPTLSHTQKSKETGVQVNKIGKADSISELVLFVGVFLSVVLFCIYLISSFVN